MALMMWSLFQLTYRSPPAGIFRFFGGLSTISGNRACDFQDWHAHRATSITVLLAATYFSIRQRTVMRATTRFNTAVGTRSIRYLRWPRRVSRLPMTTTPGSSAKSRQTVWRSTRRILAISGTVKSGSVTQATPVMEAVWFVRAMTASAVTKL